MNNSFEQMLSIVLQTNAPHIIVRCIEEEWYGKWAVFNYIILPDSRCKVIKLSFMMRRGSFGDPWVSTFIGADSLNMSFDKAISYFSNEVLRNQGANLELRS